MQAIKLNARGHAGALLTVTLLAALYPAVASGEWLSLAPDGRATAPQVVVERCDDSGLEATIGIAGVELGRMKTAGGDFVVLSWPDAPLGGQPGLPALPVVRRFIAVPPDALVDLDAESGAPTVIDLPAAGYGLPIIPLQPPISMDLSDLEQVPFHFADDAYAEDRFLPAERATLTRLGLVRGWQLYLLEVRPLAYNPVRDTLMLWPELRISVSFDGGADRGGLGTLPALGQVLLNPPRGREGRASGNYLIVVTEGLAPAIASFATAKQAEGFTVTTHSVPAGTSKETIRNDIRSWYNPDVASYVLLVGDTDTIPEWDGQGDNRGPTDLPYACMDAGDDWYFDVAIGRFAVRSTTDLQAVVNKTLFVADGVFADPGYMERAVFMAGNDLASGAEQAHDWVADTYLTPDGMDPIALYTRDGASTTDVTNAFNLGAVYGVFHGHSWSDCWQDGPYFGHPLVRGLANAGKYPFILSLTCNVGNYSHGGYEPCYAEEWLRVSNKGAAAVIAASDYIYYTNNPGWPETANTEKFFFETVCVDGVREIGPAWQATMLRLLAFYGAGNPVCRDYFEMFNLLGDPSLRIPPPKSPLRVRPPLGLTAEGPPGGPFSPDSAVYEITNTDTYAIDYQVTHDGADWVTLSGDLAGPLSPDETALVTVEINSNADGLPNGQYESVVSFTNVTDHVGDTTRTVTLNVGLPQVQYQWPLDSDPGWTTEGLWAYGHPTGGGGQYGGPDPDSGYTGSNVYGYNLYGDYENNLPEQHLTSTAIDCTDLIRVSLRFWRWLGVEDPTQDHAYLRVSNNGTDWVTLWENQWEHADEAWQFEEFDISAIADDQPTLYLRWTIGPTDSSWRYCGWNLDDIELWGVAVSDIPGDLNGDGCVNQSDLGILLADWGCTGGNCPGDADNDGDTDHGDLGVLLSHWNEGCG